MTEIPNKTSTPPKVCIIIPIYNAQRYLEKCLESAINQTLTNIEIICVNDGSTDLSLSIINRYADKDERIVVVDKENGGLSSARNAALDIAKGKYIAFLDADDYLDLDALRIFYETMERENVDAVICAIRNFTLSSDAKIEERKISEERYAKSKTMREGKYAFGGGFSRFSVTACGKLYKRSIIDKYQMRFPSGLINEDEAWYWNYFLRVGDVYYVDRDLYIRLVHEDSIMFRLQYNSDKVMDLISILEIIYGYLIESGKREIYFEQYKNCFIELSDNVLTRTKKMSRVRAAKKLNALSKKYGLNYQIKYVTLLDRIFSIKDADGAKVIRILGFKIKMNKINN